MQDKSYPRRGKPQEKTPRLPPTTALGVRRSARSTRSSLLAAPTPSCRCRRPDPIAVLYDSPGLGDTVKHWAERTGAPRCLNSDATVSCRMSPGAPGCPGSSQGSESPSTTMPPLVTRLWAPLYSAWPRRLVALPETPRQTGPVLVRRCGEPDPFPQHLRLGDNDLGRPSGRLRRDDVVPYCLFSSSRVAGDPRNYCCEN